MKRIFEKLVFGAEKFVPAVILKDGGKVCPEYKAVVNENKKTAAFSAECDKFKDTFYFTYSGGEVLCKRIFENVSGGKLDLVELGLEICGISFGGDPKDDYFYHNENPRIYGIYTLPIDFDRTNCDAEAEKWGIDIDIK
ncbi:MAG: hypothetical protein IKW02_01585, partial [Clostridia bacterium]|nr:hypothetical protein [Clostridia bacterium]